ncbi:ABC transporter ATP-binding protein [Faecalispora jeddahensis]|uniref:ABC transporter ATP-binding protein n=1 Tax=Faecalispora jeddahensis TaxID=1414721 RepID=UPI00145A24EF|nr:ATP-binding cassette domain-containing protein [Faecalispora jeddahensis]MBE6745117.1 ATP-binding cassette domain-containing protein [Oscillospiraceae bacterium]
MELIKINQATKILKGRTVLDHVNLTLEQGGIYGFFGPNGSGKTMLFRAICGLIYLNSGEISVFGKRVGEKQFPDDLGLVIESVGFWNEFTGFENLKFLAAIKGKITEKDITAVLERVGLDPGDTRIYKKYSLGMKQRLAIAQAVMEQPRLLVLDEPSNALDEDGVRAIHQIIREENQRGCTVLIASHNKSDIDSLCQRKFKMIDGTLQEISSGSLPENGGDST